MSEGLSSSSKSVMEEVVKHIREQISYHVDMNEARLVTWELVDQTVPNEVDAMLCETVATACRHTRDSEKTIMVQSLLGLVEEARAQDHSTADIYEYTVDRIFNRCFRDDSINLYQYLMGLMMSTDHSLKTRVLTYKWLTALDMIKEIDTKTLRMYTSVFVEQIFPKMPSSLSCHQVEMVKPIMDVLEYCLSSVPPMFAMAFGGDLQGKKLQCRFPVMMHKLTEFHYDFRPVADLSSCVGRMSGVPIPGHPQFNPTAVPWTIDGHSLYLSCNKMCLPVRRIFHGIPVYLFFMLLRQPRGRDYISQMMHSVSRSKFSEVFDNVFILFICLASDQAELLKEDEEINRYMWDNLFALAQWAISKQYVNMTLVLRTLTKVTEKAVFLRARDEIMWFLLQVVGFHHACTSEHLALISQLYKLLFPSEVVWAGRSSEEEQDKLVRFLAAACLFHIMDGQEGLEQPTESLQQQINFLRQEAQQLEANAEAHSEKGVIVINGYRSQEPLMRKLLTGVYNWLEGSGHEGGMSESVISLPYGRLAHPRLMPMRQNAIDSYTHRGKMHLMHQLTMKISNMDSNRLPSPAVIETLGRLMHTAGDFESSIKTLTSELSRAITSATGANSMVALPNDKDIIAVHLDMLAYRLCNVVIPHLFRFQYITSPLINFMLSNAAQENMELFTLVEQTVLRNLIWIPFADIKSTAGLILSSRNQSEYSKMILNPGDYTNANSMSISPELARLFLYNYLRSIKISGSVVGVGEDVFYQRILNAYPWTASQLSSFPAVFATWKPEGYGPNLGEYQARLDRIMSTAHEDYTMMTGIQLHFWHDYTLQHPDIEPRLLCVLFQFVAGHGQNPTDIFHFKKLCYHYIGKMNVRRQMLMINTLTDYVLGRCQLEPVNLKLIVDVLIDMIFKLEVVRLDRLLLSLAVHPSTDEKTATALLVIKTILESKEVLERLEKFCLGTYRPQRPPCDSERTSDRETAKDFFRSNFEFHKMYPELSMVELFVACDNQQKQNVPIDMFVVPVIDAKQHLPVYYGNVIQRLLPITDYILARALETRMSDVHLADLFRAMAPIYKFHPSPITMLFSIVHSLYDSGYLAHSPRCRQLVLHVMQDQMRVFTDIFRSGQLAVSPPSKGALVAYVGQLVGRIIDSTQIVNKPPEYVTQDWRFAELSPGGESLYVACIELIAGTAKPEEVVDAVVELLYASRLVRQQPFAALNAAAQLVSALPERFGHALHRMFLQVLQGTSLDDELDFTDIVMDNFLEYVVKHENLREMTINYLLQTYWHHSNNLTSKQLLDFVNNVVSEVKTENGLWYLLRFISPIIQYFCSYGKAEVVEDFLWNSRRDCNRIAELVLDKVGELADARAGQTPIFHHPITICDLLYLWKYMFIGYALNDKVTSIMPKLPYEMRQRMESYTSSHPSGEEGREGGQSGEAGRRTTGPSTSHSHSKLDSSSSMPL